MSSRYDIGIVPKELYSHIDRQQFYFDIGIPIPVSLTHPQNNLNKNFKVFDDFYIPNSQDVENHHDYIFTRINLQNKELDPRFNLYRNLKYLESKNKRYKKERSIDYLFHRDHYKVKTMTQYQHDCSQNFNTRYDYNHNFYQGYRFSAHENAD